VRTAALLLLLAFASCSPEIIYMYPEPEPAPAEVVESSPAWQPEPWHIYVFDDADTILVDELAQPEAVYRSRYQCWALTVECHNIIDDPVHPWRLVGGGTQ